MMQNIACNSSEAGCFNHISRRNVAKNKRYSSFFDVVDTEKRIDDFTISM